MIQVTESARRQVRHVMQRESMAGLRLGVRGGGCSSFSYVIRYEKEAHPKDRVFQFDEDVRIFIDPKSLLHLDGLTLDWKNTLMEQGFVLTNPHATKTCGCGLSFSS